MAWLVVQAEDGVAVVNAWMREVHVCRMIWARSAGNHKFFSGERLNRTVVALQRQGVFIHKMRVTLQNFTVVALIETLTHARLLVNDRVCVIQDIGKGRTKKSGVVAVKRVLVKFDNAANGVAEGFRRDGAPVGATAADIMVALNNRYSGSLFYQTHSSTFAAGAGTNNYCVVIVGMWHGKAYLFLYIKATES